MRWQHLVCLPSRPSMSIHRHKLVWARVGRGRSGCMHRNLLRLLVGRLWRLRLVRLRVRRRLWRFCTLIASGSPAAPTSCGRCRRTQHLQVDWRRFAVRVQSLVAFAHQLRIVCATPKSATGRVCHWEKTTYASRMRCTTFAHRQVPVATQESHGCYMSGIFRAG